jgi:hypothetical protein
MSFTEKVGHSSFETNRFRLRAFCAIQKHLRPIPYRAVVLGMRTSVSSYQYKSLFWTLLPWNAEVVVEYRNTMIGGGCFLPTPATAVATSNATPLDKTSD